MTSPLFEDEAPRAELSTCPYCLNPLQPSATKCGACGANVGDVKICSGCAEPVRRVAATCPFCRTDLRPPPPVDAELLKDPWVIYASPVGAAIPPAGARK